MPQHFNNISQLAECALNKITEEKNKTKEK